MLKFERNALRIGHRVVVHDTADNAFPLLAGTVAFVDTKRSKRGANGVGVRVATPGGEHRVIWPSRLAAHHDLPDPAEDCWRCAALADEAARLAATVAAPVAIR